MKKRGAINLSINMIIVLIIAIIILGFALSFITDLFGRTSESIWDQLPSSDVDVSADKPIGVPDTFRIEAGKERTFILKIFHNGASSSPPIIIQDPTSSPPGNPSIQGCQSGSQLSFSRIQPLANPIQSGQTAEVGVVFQAGSTVVDNDICTIQVRLGSTTNYITQSFFLSKG